MRCVELGWGHYPRVSNTGVQNFFIKMKYPEMIAVMSELVPRHFPAGSMRKRFGDEENNLYFVVSGTLEKTIYHRFKKGGRVQKKSTKNLGKNDFFGDIDCIVPASKRTE